jgi:HPt (histidine-containing phosphotransfer) domain-containing protein
MTTSTTDQPQNEGSTSIDSVVFNYNGLMERLIGDTALATKILDVFINDMPKQISTLKQGLVNNDCKLVQLQAHGIKGAAANTGTLQFRTIAAKIELDASAGDLASITSTIPELEKQFEIAVKEINSIIHPAPLTQGDQS